jgi:HlyD family secretion protein
MSAATLVSPIAGTVADVTITAGQSATANSTTAHVMIVGPGEDEVTTAVSDTEVGKVKPGQSAAVIPDGATKPIVGKVTSIGALGSTTSGGSASYPVTISLNPTQQQLFDGATASISITLGTAQAPVTVPTSAVSTFGGFSVVSKMVAGKPTITRVTLGVVGATVTQVTAGLKAGDEVMLANVSEPMPSSNTNARGFGGGGAARFAGGGGGAAFAGGGAAGGGAAGGAARPGG